MSPSDPNIKKTLQQFTGHLLGNAQKNVVEMYKWIILNDHTWIFAEIGPYAWFAFEADLYKSKQGVYLLLLELLFLGLL